MILNFLSKIFLNPWNMTISSVVIFDVPEEFTGVSLVSKGNKADGIVPVIAIVSLGSNLKLCDTAALLNTNISDE